MPIRTVALMLFMTGSGITHAYAQCDPDETQTSIWMWGSGGSDIGASSNTSRGDSCAGAGVKAEVWVEGYGGPGAQTAHPGQGVTASVHHFGSFWNIWRATSKHWYIHPNGQFDAAGSKTASRDLGNPPDPGQCTQAPEYCTPIIIDVVGNGYRLTAAATGVWFDIDANGTRERIGWTARGSDDSFLVLDRNGNGIVDDARELFGNVSPLSDGQTAANGFDALVDLDEGGRSNSNGVIDADDAVFAQLRLWRDANHDGRSQTHEITGLTEHGISRLWLGSQTHDHVDRHGNQFALRGRLAVSIRGVDHPRWMYDVTLTVDR